MRPDQKADMERRTAEAARRRAQPANTMAAPEAPRKPQSVSNGSELRSTVVSARLRRKSQAKLFEWNE